MNSVLHGYAMTAAKHTIYTDPMPDQAHDLRRLAFRRPAPSPHARRAFVVAVVGGKTGAGATTVAMNLAAASSESGRRAVFVARDPCGKLADQIIGAVDENRIEAELVVFDVGNPIGDAGANICRRSDQVLVVAAAMSADVLGAYETVAALTAVLPGKNIHTLKDRPTPESASDELDDRIRLLINKSPSVEAANSAHKRIAWAARRFLGTQVRSAGYIEIEKKAVFKRMSRFCLNLRALSVDSMRQLLVSDSLLKWRRRSDFNDYRPVAIAEQLEMDF